MGTRDVHLLDTTHSDFKILITFKSVNFQNKKFFSLVHFCLTRYFLHINMFGKDLDLARQQFLCHLQRHTATLKGHVMCQMSLDPPLWKPMAEFCLNTLGVELVKEYTEQCVVESDVI